jgi:ferredoxin
MSLFGLLHGYVYALWPYLYISTAVGEHPLARVVRPLISFWTKILAPIRGSRGAATPISWADTYHGKVMPLAAASRLVSVNEDICLTDLEQVIPYPLARDIVLKNPDHIVALECPCRASRAEPCIPLDVCLIVGEPFASLVAEHHPERSRWIGQHEAVSILEAEQKRGHVSHAFFKDAMLGRFYAICNCCSCCCGAMQAWQHGTPMLASSGYVCQVAPQLCAGCGQCGDLCQFRAISLTNGHASVEDALCMGCGVCVDQCEFGALTLVRDPSRSEPLEIHKLMAAAT